MKQLASSERKSFESASKTVSKMKDQLILSYKHFMDCSDFKVFEALKH